ncbi:hypothetical protein K438DRAFT_1965462 [Mycena galopus ATCC 62051]|nr:hypothetical protein K438DRAFT_1965462 [Mycena galopus ATCC 62051]
MGDSTRRKALAGRIQDHEAKDLIDDGYTTLEKTKLADLLRTSTERAEVLAMIRQHRQHGSDLESQGNAPDPGTMHADGDSDDSDSTNTETSDLNSGDCDDLHSGNSQSDDEEPVIGGSEWAFRMDDGDDPEWENGIDDEEEENEQDEEVDLDVDIDGWSGENDVLE